MSNARLEAEQILTAVQQAKTNAAWNKLGIEEQAAIDSARIRLTALREHRDSAPVGEAIQSLDKATRRLAELMMDDTVTRAIRGG